MNKDAKIYVAGHRGMVGSAVVRALRAAGFENIVTRTHAELDLRRQEQVERFFAEERPEYVFLCAAKVGGILANNTYKAEFIHDNLAIAMNVIDAAYRNGVGKLLNLGSSCIYPKFAPQPLREEHLLTGPLEPTNEPYAIAKIAAIKMCRYYNEQYGTDYLSLMPTNLYGPNDNFNLETAHVLPALIRKFHLAALLREGNLEGVMEDLARYRLGFGLDERIDQARPESAREVLAGIGITGDFVLLWGTGTPYREFLHADDLAAAALHVMENYTHGDVGELINVGTGKDQMISEIAAIVSEAAGFGGEIHYDTARPDGTPRKLLDVSRLAALGWQASISLREGVQKTCEWYRREVHATASLEGTI